jgi:ribokinase
VLGVGSVAVDDLVYVSRYPEPETKTRVLEIQRQGGGLTATALVTASRLGAKTACCAVLGDNDLSRFTVQELEREGVDCSPIIHRAGAQPYYAIVIVERAAGQRTILYSAAGVTFPSAEELRAEWIADCRALFVDSYAGQAALRAVQLAHAHNVPVIADIEGEPNAITLELVRQVDHLIVGIQYARQVTNASEPADIVRALSSPARACCVVTAGERGCWYAERDGPVRHFPAFAVRVVDTTGCGDVFHGAYAAIIARGGSVERAVQVATAAAGLKATQPGGRAGIPDGETVKRFLMEQGF